MRLTKPVRPTSRTMVSLAGGGVATLTADRTYSGVGTMGVAVGVGVGEGGMVAGLSVSDTAVVCPHPTSHRLLTSRSKTGHNTLNADLDVGIYGCLPIVDK